MSHCGGRSNEDAKAIDEIDKQIAELVKRRNKVMSNVWEEYDCCGEGEVYFKHLPFEQAERVYHAIAGIK